MENSGVLLVAKAGPFGDALSNLISPVLAIPQPLRAETGLLALKLIRQASPQLVIIASSIADSETIELVRQIKQTTPSVKCLVLTETVYQADQARAAGADESVFSHLSAAQLITTIQRHLRATSAYHPTE